MSVIIHTFSLSLSLSHPNHEFMISSCSFSNGEFLFFTVQEEVSMRVQKNEEQRREEEEEEEVGPLQSVVSTLQTPLSLLRVRQDGN